MDIACPTCATGYEIDDGSVGEAGRKVRCTSCGTIWRAFRDKPSEIVSTAQVVARDDIPVIAAPPPLAPSEQDIAPDPAPEPAEAMPEREPSARKAKVIREPKKRRSGPGLAARLLSLPVLLIAGTAALAAAALTQRERIVKLAPQSAVVFSAIGLPVNLRGIDIRDVKSRMVDENGISVLVIDGNLVSLSKERVNIPRLRLAVLGDKGQEVYVWSAQPDRPTLQPGETLNFRRRLAAPPSDGRDVHVRFLSASDITAGLK